MWQMYRIGKESDKQDILYIRAVSTCCHMFPHFWEFTETFSEPPIWETFTVFVTYTKVDEEVDALINSMQIPY